MADLRSDIQRVIEGDVDDSRETLKKYSHDTSLFEVKPKLVVYPKNKSDLTALVEYVNEHRDLDPTLSLTGRSAGSDMSGGPLNTSIILDFTKYFTDYDVDEDNLKARVEPGVYYRDFEKEILPEHLSLPPYPASKRLAALGGMIMNNCAGENTLRYGQMRNFVNEITMVLRDGKAHTFRKLNREELDEKLKEDNFEGELYRKMYTLLDENYDMVQQAKPKTSKNSAGYALWDIYDREAGTFDLAQLFVGSQGTLGLFSSAQVRLVDEKPHKRLITLFFSSWDDMPDVVNDLLPYDPESLEAFDKETLKLGIRFMPEIAKRAGSRFIPFVLQFLPEVGFGLRMFGLPELIVLVELSEDSKEELERKSDEIDVLLRKREILHRVIRDEKEAEKYWVMRRESFSLLREHVHGKRTVPFIDDFCINPKDIPSFLPKAVSLLKSYGIKVNIAGHAGNGNFHIIPLMDLSKKSEREKIFPLADEFYDLVISYKGTITAEHNDGLIRSAYLEKMYGKKVYTLFEEVKNIFDPDNIFNPGKKVFIDEEFIEDHIRKDV